MSRAICNKVWEPGTILQISPLKSRQSVDQTSDESQIPLYGDMQQKILVWNSGITSVAPSSAIHFGYFSFIFQRQGLDATCDKIFGRFISALIGYYTSSNFRLSIVVIKSYIRQRREMDAAIPSLRSASIPTHN